jgi:hypothetical protein
VLPLPYSVTRYVVLAAIVFDQPERGGTLSFVLRIDRREAVDHGLANHYRVLRRRAATDPDADVDAPSHVALPVGYARSALDLWRAGLLSRTLDERHDGRSLRVVPTADGYETLVGWNERVRRHAPRPVAPGRVDQTRPAGFMALDDAMKLVYERYGDALERLGRL